MRSPVRDGHRKVRGRSPSEQRETREHTAAATLADQGRAHFRDAEVHHLKVHVLTSIDYDKMSAEDKAMESQPRTDADYALSCIRREGKGRVFYEGHGHSDRVYAMTPMLEHLRAGIQYALGDLKADDSPLSQVGSPFSCLRCADQGGQPSLGSEELIPTTQQDTTWNATVPISPGHERHQTA